MNEKKKGETRTENLNEKKNRMRMGSMKITSLALQTKTAYAMAKMLTHRKHCGNFNLLMALYSITYTFHYNTKYMYNRYIYMCTLCI